MTQYKYNVCNMPDLTLIPVYKPVGVTSTDVVNQYKQRLGTTELMHTGALDPLAEGLLLLVKGTTSPQEIQQYTDFDKTYEFEFVLGVATDTWDVLGLVCSVALPDRVAKITYEQVQTLESNFVGEVMQTVPVFSNMRYKNKRMYQWAREGKAHLVPELQRQREISSFTIHQLQYLTWHEWYSHVVRKITLVKGDFRQEAIAARWAQAHQALHKHSGLALPLVSATLQGASGTYVRSVVHAIGQQLGVGATTWHITRTAVGPYTLKDVSE